MNALLQQFLVEARDFLDQIGQKLLLLEGAPEGAELTDDIFRLIHTLKGNSGLFDMPSLTRLLHAAEDLLDSVRDGTLAIDYDLTDSLLRTNDFLLCLLDEIEATGSISPRLAAESDEIASALRMALPVVCKSDVVDSCQGIDAAPDWDWLKGVPDVERLGIFECLAGKRAHAIRYLPEPECFFNGQDPLQMLRATPGLLLFNIAPAEPWPAADHADIYRCGLVIDALSDATTETLEAHFAYVREQIALYPIPAYALALPDSPLVVEDGDIVVSAFLDQARKAIAAGDWRGVGSAAEATLDLLNPTNACVSALRWIMKMAGSNNDAAISGHLFAVAVGESARADWHAFSISSSGDSFAAGEPVEPDFRELARAQIEMLEMPASIEEMPGRIESAQKALAGLLTCMDRQRRLRDLDVVAEAAISEANTERLIAFIHASVLEEDSEKTTTRDELDTIGKPAKPFAEEPEDRSASPDPEPRGAISKRTPVDRGVRTLKVAQEKVDRLMGLVGELIVAKNALPYLASRAEQHFGSRELSREIKAQYAIINRVAEEMQDGIMQVRMLPVGAIFQRFPRLVRDVSRQLEKTVKLTVEGEETEADKNIIEALADPLIHILRNSLDHGLETPDIRRAAGKSEEGRLSIRAFHEGDRILISIEDDGRGIDPAVIREKAIEKGLIDAPTCEGLSDNDAIQLVFAPGFSTARQISALSGRGVGMDVVKSSVEKIGGQVRLTSEKGRGTQIMLSLPLSMSMSNVMMVGVAGQNYGVPLDVVVETVRVAAGNIHFFKLQRAAVLRGLIVPLYSACELLGYDGDPKPNADGEFAVLVARVRGETIGIIVDGFAQTVDVILKPLEGALANLTGFAGSALLGDGSVLLVLDLRELI